MSDQTINITRPQPSTVKTVEKSKFPAETIGLPSDGFFYNKDNPLSKGTVEIKHMTAKEEDILSSQNLIKKGIVLEKLLESLIVTTGVNIDDLLIGDKNALFVAARRLAYGDNYGPVDIVCPKCSKENRCTLDLSKVNNKDFDFTKYQRGINTFEYLLPATKLTVKYKLLTHKDEHAIDQEIASFNKTFKNGTSPEVTTRLKKMIISVDGNDDRQYINKFVETELLSRDSLALRNYVKETTPDIDMNFDFECNECGHVERMGIPMEVSFFWPNS
jgi:hypothetical protein